MHQTPPSYTFKNQIIILQKNIIERKINYMYSYREILIYESRNQTIARDFSFQVIDYQKIRTQK